ncbi:MAG: 2,3-bisphosphoglycerate-independent phosphoglycerate mutase [Gammaproteobacteria bacterium]
MATLKHPALLVVLDGWGYSENTVYNAIYSARTPQWDAMWSECPHLLIHCSGLAVGLPDQQMGNSEVGHMNMGAGRVIYQDFTRISQAIRDGEFLRNTVFAQAFSQLPRERAVHILGLLSPGGVHSHQEQLLALIELAARHGLHRIYLHAFLDGRDTPPTSAGHSIAWVEQACAKLGAGRIASIVGRYFAMDRNKNWDRIRLAYDLIVDGAARDHAKTSTMALDNAYARGETDEFVHPCAIHANDEAPVQVADGDLVIFANFRADRARQLTSAFTTADFAHFERRRVPNLAGFITMTDYGAQFTVPVAFPTVDLTHTLGELVAREGLRQLRIAETEKYAHVTFFFNGGEERPFPGEERILIPSPQVATYDMKPEMSASEVTARLIDAIASRAYDLIICNFANADMVGHTGDFAATVACIETLDQCLGRIRAACGTYGMELVITSDHGNAEQMRVVEAGVPLSEPHTAHTNNLVPLIYCGRAATVVGNGSLCDIAPTLLALMGLAQPPAMTGHSLVRLNRKRAQHAA